MAALSRSSSRATAGKETRVSRAAPAWSHRRARDPRPITHQARMSTIRGSQAGVTEMHRGASTKGAVSRKVAEKEGNRITARASRTTRTAATARARMVAALIQTEGASWRMGSIKPSSSRLVHTVFTTEQRKVISPSRMAVNICHTTRPSIQSTAAILTSIQRVGSAHRTVSRTDRSTQPVRKRVSSRDCPTAEEKDQRVLDSSRKSRKPPVSNSSQPGRGRGCRLECCFIVPLLPRRPALHGDGVPYRRRAAGGRRPEWSGPPEVRGWRRPTPDRPAERWDCPQPGPLPRR